MRNLNYGGCLKRRTSLIDTWADLRHEKFFSLTKDYFELLKLDKFITDIIWICLRGIEEISRPGEPGLTHFM